MKKSKINYILVITILSLILILHKKNICASTLELEKIADTPKYMSNDVGSNYMYKIDDMVLYSLVPTKDINADETEYEETSAQISDANDAEYKIKYILAYKKRESYEDIQAAIWKINGYELSGNEEDLQYVDQMIQDAIDYKNDVQENPYNLKNSFFKNGYAYMYNVAKDAYIYNDLVIGKFERLSLGQGVLYEKWNGTSYEEYKEKYGTYSEGKYNIIVPRKILQTNPSLFGSTSYEVPGIASPIIYQDIYGEGPMLCIGSFMIGGPLDTFFINFSNIYIDGDLNLDRLVNAADASIVLDLYKNGNAQKMNYNVGDMNTDGLLNSTDAAMILDIFKAGN